MYRFHDGHHYMMSFLNTTMVNFEVHKDYAPENDIHSVEWLDNAIIVPSNQVADYIASCYVNQWFDEKNRKNSFKVKARIKVIMQSIVTGDIVTTFSRVGANPKIQETEQNQAFIQYLKNADIGKQTMDIFTICATCYPDWLKSKVDENNFRLDNDGQATNEYGFVLLKNPKNLQKIQQVLQMCIGLIADSGNSVL